MKLSAMKRDVDLAENGVWVTNAFGDLDIMVAAGNNKNYAEMLRKLAKPYQRSFKTMDDNVFIDIQNKCYAATILLGWRNMEDDDGKEIKYSEEKALELLSDPENLEFRDLVLSLADEVEVFRKGAVEQATFPAK